MGGYVPNTEKERQEMLQAAGYSDMNELFADIPDEVRLKGELEIPAGMPELSVRREMEKMAGRNQLFPTISGCRSVPALYPGSCHKHHIQGKIL